jgi:hypothetical protein
MVWGKLRCRGHCFDLSRIATPKLCVVNTTAIRIGPEVAYRMQALAYASVGADWRGDHCGWDSPGVMLCVRDKYKVSSQEGSW